MTNALGKTTTYSYDTVGNRTGVTDPMGRTTTTAYDTMNRVVSVTDAGSRITQYSYDLAGQLTQQTSPAGRATTYTYDNGGQLTSVANALAQTESYEYDNLGRQTRVIDPRGNSTYYGYDAAGQLTSVTDALSGVVSFSYDAGGRLTGLTNANGKSTTFTHDVLGNVLTRTDPLNRTHTNSYDQYGRLATQTDARSSSVSYAYDQLDRVTTVTHSSGANSYSYDAAGRLASVTDPTGTTSYSYDALSRITGITTPQGVVNYSYNDANQRTAMTLPGSRPISYNYDAGGRLTSITDWVSGIINYSFDADGRLTGLSRSNGVNSTYNYDGAGRLTNISHDGSGGNLLFTNYTLDQNAGAPWARTAVTSNAGTESYTLDVPGAPWARLTQASYPNGDTVAYSYDANGNRLLQVTNGVTTTYSYDDAGQLLSDGATTYTYDANGNLTNAGSDTFTWDWAGAPGARLTAASVGGISASYSYDAFDIRVSGTVSGTASNYLWDRLAPYPTLVDDGVYGYIHGAGPQAQIDGGGNRHYLLSDALASIRGVTDGSGALVGTTAYDAFGGIRSQSGLVSAFGYSGEQYTPATGLLHLRARDLNPALGRLLSVDTVQPNAPGSQGFNAYAYVANNPTTWVDPSGHFVGASGYLGTAALMPTSALGAITAMSIDAVLALGRNPGSWRFPENFRTSGIVFATFAVILACALAGCFSNLPGGIISDNGSDSPFGARPWPPAALPGAPNTHPESPSLPFRIPGTQPGTTTGTGTPSNPSPNPGPPGWFWPVAILTGLATAITTWVMPGPGRNPGPQTGPIDDILSTPAPSPTPTEEPTCAPDVNYLKQRSTEVWKEWTQGFFLAEINRTVAVLRVRKSNNTCIDIVGGGAAKDLPYAFQTTVLRNNEELARSPDDHAEITVLKHASDKAYGNVAMGVCRNICPDCRERIVNDYRGMLIGPREAIWVNP